MTDRVAAAPPRRPGPVILAGILLVLAGFGGFAAWAALAPLASGVMAPGEVKVDSNRKSVQHLEGGLVKTLHVRDGDRVAAGDVLVTLDETRARSTLGVLRSGLAAALAQEARLRAERDDAPAIAFPADLTGRADDPEVADAMAGERLLFDARRASQMGEAEILEQRVAQMTEEIAGLEAQRDAVDRQRVLIGKEVKSMRTLLEKGLAQLSRVLALERQQAQLDGQHGELTASIARVREAIGEARLTAIQTRQAWHQEVVAGLREVQDKIHDLEERLAAAQFVLDHVEIRAPVAGVVVGLTAHTVGGVIRPGETILDIVPEGDRLIVEARVRPEDVEVLVPGQPADVRLTGFRQRVTPVVPGELAYLSADRQTDERTGAPFYVARVAVTEAAIQAAGVGALRPGMPAEVIVRTGARTPLDYLMQPLKDSLSRAWLEN